MKAVRVHEPGGPEVLRYEEVPTPEPGPGEVRVRLEACGVNFIDVYHRKGLYPRETPFVIGQEGAGRVDALGEGVEGFSEGDYVAFASAPGGAYAEYAVVPADRLVPVNVTLVEARVAAAAMLQGMTAHYLTHSTFPLEEGHAALVHAAAGGVGLLLIQMAKMRGATVIGTAGTEEKARLAREAGADEVILYTEQDFVEETRRITGGDGVHVVYDSVGRATFEGGLDVLRLRGYMVLFGQSSGPVPPVDLQILNQKGGLFVTRPSLAHYTATREELLWRAESILSWIGNGTLKVRIGGTYPLSEAAKAHEDLEGRRTTGKLLLIP
ncbi:Quinone oxidoreductase 1 [Rubrobacter xylanophilus DSM 9941]|uniref:quinone oxidoreductase family protein n=1 Tax=Rubrobacter xylanophilus TaxID=49319 RepID=UPI001C641780|nr:quinone oxidoreductase [Rubrobacter xylanophilus]QYJ17159.1 Quinone oxidoreductase 1 [Rubrobacter xylanophilus DSM 9941]